MVGRGLCFVSVIEDRHKLSKLCPCVLIVQHPLMRENIWCLVFCSCVSLLRIMVSRFIHVPAKDMNTSFLCIVFHGVYVPHFLYPVSLMGIWVGSKSLLMCCKWTFMCMCPYSGTIYSLLNIYPVMGLLGQLKFLFLRPWGIATLSSTMVGLMSTIIAWLSLILTRLS